mgnify:CR=1 FL=1
MKKIELTTDQLIALVGKRKAAKAFPEIFEQDDSMHEITDINQLMSVVDEDAPGNKYKKRAILLGDAYHWNIMKRTVNGKHHTYLIPVKRVKGKRNPFVGYSTISNANPKRLAKVAAKRKYTRKTKQA